MLVAASWEPKLHCRHMLGFKNQRKATSTDQPTMRVVIAPVVSSLTKRKDFSSFFFSSSHSNRSTLGFGGKPLRLQTLVGYKQNHRTREQSDEVNLNQQNSVQV